MTRQQPAEVRRQAILAAASALLVKEGLAATSIDAVARRAGIAKGTVYLYFASRSDLLAELRNRYGQGLADRAGAALDRSRAADAGSTTRAFQRMATEVVEYVLANRRLYHVLFQEAGVAEEETMAPLRAVVVARLREAMERGAVKPMDPDLLMRFLVDGLHGAILPLFHERSPNRTRVQAGLNELIHRVLQAPVKPD